MKYAAIMGNDVLDGFHGTTVSFWTQGCPFHCKGCHNAHTWDFNGGIEDDVEHIISIIKEKLVANGVQRDFSVLGGEPLCDENFENVLHITGRSTDGRAIRTPVPEACRVRLRTVSAEPAGIVSGDGSCGRRTRDHPHERRDVPAPAPFLR